MAKGMFSGASEENLQGPLTRLPAIVDALGLGGCFVESRCDRRAAAAQKSLSAVLESLRHRTVPAGITRGHPTLLKLAYHAFQHCRHFTPKAGAWLNVIANILPETLKQGVLTVNVDESYVEQLTLSAIESVRSKTGSSSVMSPRIR